MLTGEGRSARRKNGLDMRIHDQFQTIFRAIAHFVAPLPSPRFDCGDCERNAQCGLPPHDDCVERLAQIARDGDSRPRRPNYFIRRFGPVEASASEQVVWRFASPAFQLIYVNRPAARRPILFRLADQPMRVT